MIKSHSIMNCLLNSNPPPLAPTADLRQLDEYYQYVMSLESWTEPILINPSRAVFQIYETSRNRGAGMESGHCVMLVLPAVLPRMGVPPEWAMNARD